MFTREPGPCPICGAPNHQCTHSNEPVRAVKALDFSVRAPQGGEAALPYRSLVRVIENGAIKYGIGAPIPVVEAVRQGIVTLEELPERQRIEVALLLSPGNGSVKVDEPKGEPIEAYVVPVEKLQEEAPQRRKLQRRKRVDTDGEEAERPEGEASEGQDGP